MWWCQRGATCSVSRCRTETVTAQIIAKTGRDYPILAQAPLHPARPQLHPKLGEDCDPDHHHRAGVWFGRRNHCREVSEAFGLETVGSTSDTGDCAHSSLRPAVGSATRGATRSTGSGSYAGSMSCWKLKTSVLRSGAEEHQSDDKREFWIAYDEMLLVSRAELLKYRGYEVGSARGKDGANRIFDKCDRYRIFIRGHAAPKETREDRVRWLKAPFPRIQRFWW
jgi:hypothetical protein